VKLTFTSTQFRG